MRELMREFRKGMVIYLRSGRMTKRLLPHIFSLPTKEVYWWLPLQIHDIKINPWTRRWEIFFHLLLLEEDERGERLSIKLVSVPPRVLIRPTEHLYTAPKYLPLPQEDQLHTLEQKCS